MSQDERDSKTVRLVRWLLLIARVLSGLFSGPLQMVRLFNALWGGLDIEHCTRPQSLTCLYVQLLRVRRSTSLVARACVTGRTGKAVSAQRFVRCFLGCESALNSLY
eukprot:3366010-Amphidinium_carterae.2